MPLTLRELSWAREVTQLPLDISALAQSHFGSLKKKGMVWLLLILFCCDKRKDMMEGYIRKKKNLCVGRSFCSAGCLCLCLCGMVNGKTHDIMFLQMGSFLGIIESPKSNVLYFWSMEKVCGYG